MTKTLLMAVAVLLCLVTSSSFAQQLPLGKEFEGKASYYADNFYGQTTANGETLKEFAMTAAHKSLPFGTMVEVTNLSNGKSVVVRINDRGPYKPGRIIDLTDIPAKRLGIMKAGVVPIRMRIVGIDGVVVLDPDEVILASLSAKKKTSDLAVVR
jgi:rare lipoprotein A